jgi:hypothetical protein
MGNDDDGVVVATGVVRVSHHQLGVIDASPEGTYFPVVPAPRTNRLVAVYEGAAVVWTGIHSGVVAVTTEARPGPPPTVDVDGWDEVVEVSLDMANGDARLAVLMDNVPEAFSCLTPAGPGTYRLRAHARGRDTAIDGMASEPFEHYLLTLWPAPPAATAIHKETDRYGAGWHPYDPDAPPVPPPTRDEWDPSRRDVGYSEPQAAPKPER